MKNKIIYFLYFCLVAIVLPGCTTLDLRQANYELADLYSAKTEAVNNKYWEQEVTVNSALSALADQAAKECESVSISQVNRISFCRIAATAAWQAVDGKVIEYAEVGASLCNKSDNFNKMPRDCGMLLVIPNLASLDELTKRYNEINKRIIADSNPPSTEEVAKLFEDIKYRVKSLLKHRNTIMQSNAHPKLLESTDKYIGTLLCSQLNDTRGLILKYEGAHSATYKKSLCDDYDLKIELKSLSFSQQIAPCMPPGNPVKPAACK